VVFLFDGYCSTVQGLLDWFEVDLGFAKLRLFRLIYVLSVFSSPTFSFRSPLVLSLSSPPFRTSWSCTASPAWWEYLGVSLQSCQSHGSFWGPCYSLWCHGARSKDHFLYFINDKTDDSSIHRGTYHILESTSSTMGWLRLTGSLK